METGMAAADGAAIRVVEPTAAEMEAMRALWRAYGTWADGIGAHVCLDGFEAELAALPGPYARPAGRLLLAVAGPDRAVGCVGLRPLDGGACEMKRLYVRPEARGRGLGARLVAALVAAAREAGHRRMVLETLPAMAEARRLYTRCGFREAPPAAPGPRAEVIRCELDLTGPSPAFEA